MKEKEPMTRIIRPLRSGQITIPAEFRKRLGIAEDSLLQVTLKEGELSIKPVRVSERPESSAWLKELYDLFAPMRDEATKYSEAEIDEAIDKAVSATRHRHA